MLTDLTFTDLHYICTHMREKDQQEIYNLRPHDNPLQLAYEAHHIIKNTGRGTISWANGRPAGVGAFTEDWPGAWQVWMFGTDDFVSALIPLMRWIRTEANDILSVCKAHRLQCDSRADYEDAHKLIRSMGGRPEGPPMRKYGKDGSDYQRFVWFTGENDSFLRPNYVQEKLEPRSIDLISNA